VQPLLVCIQQTSLKRGEERASLSTTLTAFTTATATTFTTKTTASFKSTIISTITFYFAIFLIYHHHYLDGLKIHPINTKIIFFIKVSLMKRKWLRMFITLKII